MQSQVLTLPPEPVDGRSATHVSTKENVVIWFCSLHNRLDFLKGIIIRSDIFFNTFTLSLLGNINILIVQYASMFVLNSALKGFDDTPQSKSKATARWIVVKVSHLNNASSYILVLCRLICT